MLLERKGEGLPASMFNNNTVDSSFDSRVSSALSNLDDGCVVLGADKHTGNRYVG